MELREFRMQHGYTLEDIAISTGYSLSAISKYERNIESMTEDFVQKVFDAYGVVIEQQKKWWIDVKNHEKTITNNQQTIDNLLKAINELEEENKQLKDKLSLIKDFINTQI